ncbi:APH(3'') family aminoglycoside O-phosphotransferase [Microbacterium resistens]|uniref:APH(3'') family aminoglycoside O-phosphotransferase n=1 Tax=Microbacterium resistens TaxID=156977 RepID=A0ABY3RQE8_9MICO|nr:APH(3'') family aminoglycoside O-phosphotransferase [Microbacterium resistens]UGS26267.1 APH(3'') family aminoglycoside O-phosphotransferase [Microbacterium resistens]
MNTEALVDPRDEWIPITTGESGDRVLRRADGAVFAKIAETDRVADLAAERDRLEWLAGRGIAAPEPRDWREGADGACLVMTAIPGVPASELAGKDLLAAWPSIAQCLAALHALDAATCPFDRGLERMFARAQDVVGRGAVDPDFLPDEDRGTPAPELLARVERELARRLSLEAHEEVVCHGDPCLPNLLVDPETLRCNGMIDLGRLGRADRYADLALLRANAAENWSSAAQAEEADAILFATLGITDPDLAAAAFYLRLDPLTWG